MGAVDEKQQATRTLQGLTLFVLELFSGVFLVLLIVSSDNSKVPVLIIIARK